MTLHHACQPPIHLSAKWPASPWLSAAAIMIMYFSTALPFFSPYFLFQSETQQRLQQWDPSWSTWAAKCQAWQVLSHHKHQWRSPTFSLRDFKLHTFPLYISRQCLLASESPSKHTFSCSEQMSVGWIGGPDRMRISWYCRLFQAWEKHVSMLCIILWVYKLESCSDSDWPIYTWLKTEQ